MGQVAYVLYLFFILGAVSASSVDKYPKKNVRKSSLILEYNWPEPSKSLSRLPDPRSCNHFVYTKQDGTHVVKRCHGDKIFDYRTLRCQNKSSAKCWMNIVKKGNIKKIKRPFSCPFPWGLYPDKEDCSMFYDCMGGKIFPRKCPESTLFDVVERICVHSKKALCAGDSDTNAKDEATSVTSQAYMLSKTTTNKKDFDSEEDSSEEISRKHRTKSKNKFTTPKLSLASTTPESSKSFKTIGEDSEEDSSEEIDRKHRTKPENKFTTSKSSLFSTSTANSKIYRTKVHSEEDSSEEENSSEESTNKINSNYDLKLITPKIKVSTDNDYNKKLSSITSSPQNRNSPELLIQSTIIKSFGSTENKLKPIITATPKNREQDGTINDNVEKVFSTERISKEFTSSVKPSNSDSLKPVKITTISEGIKETSNINDDITKVTRSRESISEEFTLSSELSSHKKIDSTTKIQYTVDLSTEHSTETKNLESKSTTHGTLCPDFDGYFPHPENKHLFVACIGGKPTVMACPKNLVYDSNTRSCNYDKI